MLVRLGTEGVVEYTILGVYNTCTMSIDVVVYVDILLSNEFYCYYES